MKASVARPPVLARWLMGSLLPAEFRDAMLGDLIEEYEAIRALTGSAMTANCWFWSQTWRSIHFLLWSVLRYEPFRSLHVAFGVFVVMAGLKYETSSLLAKFVAGHELVQVALGPVIFVAIGALGGCVTARIRYQAIVALTALVITSVIVLIVINACPIPVPWWYRPSFLALAPLAVLVPPAILRVNSP